MPEELSIYDKTTNRLHDLRFKVRTRLHEQFARTKPYRGEEITRDEELYAYNQLTDTEMMTLIEKHGPETINAFVQDMEEMKKRRGIR